MAVSVQGGQDYENVARVLVLDKETNRALERLLLTTLKNATYLDASLEPYDIHALKMLGLTVLRGSQGVDTPLALWERELLAGDDAGPITYGDF